jgi:hypothetical protein
MISSTTRHVAAASAALIAFAGIALGTAAAAGAQPSQPKCPKNTVTIENQGQVISPPAMNQVCDDDEDTGLLGSLPVLGSLF